MNMRSDVISMLGSFLDNFLNDQGDAAIDCHDMMTHERIILKL